MKTLKAIRRIEEEGKGSGLEISFSDNSLNKIPSSILREVCPCASCRELRGDRTHQAPLSSSGFPSSGHSNSGRGILKVLKHTKDEEINIKRVWGVGTYAIGIAWGDGHDSGIYSFDFLTNLGETSNKSLVEN
jgi:DUF971 family protein